MKLKSLQLYYIGVRQQGTGYRAYMMDDETTFADGLTEYDALRGLIALIEAEAYHGG